MEELEESLMLAEDSFCDDASSPFSSPRRLRMDEPQSTSRIVHDLNRVRLTNDQGQVRLTAKMRTKEKELRKFVS